MTTEKIEEVFEDIFKDDNLNSYSMDDLQAISEYIYEKYYAKGTPEKERSTLKSRWKLVAARYNELFGEEVLIKTLKQQ